jgi:hypothetical protein
MRPSGRGIAWLASGSVVGPEHETRRIEMFKEFKDFAMQEEAKPAAPPKQEVLLEEIRDLLRTRA